MSVDYIVVQAGGKGSRMGSLTRNKPKALVPVNNKPMIFHLFDLFPDKKFIVIGDYKSVVLEKYLNAFARVDFKTVCSSGSTGTCSGVGEALSYVPEGKSFMLIWSDLILSEGFEMPQDGNFIGLSEDFVCRWSYNDGILEEERREKNGVAGLFVFKDKACLSDVPQSGEFVRWLSSEEISFEPIYLNGTKEYGTIENYPEETIGRCRPFNKLEKSGNIVRKIPLTELGETLAVREAAWYKKAIEMGVQNIPEIYGYTPLSMKHIKGKNIFDCSQLNFKEKYDLLVKIINGLKQLHNLKMVESSYESYYDNYIGKTFERLEKVRNLIPFADCETVTVNGRVCRNVYFHKEELEHAVMQYFPEKFYFIHGDCTFSNILVDECGNPVFIDPRGYFGKTEYYGDKAYDWAKLYYSIFSNYDQFNIKNFELYINDSEVILNIGSNNWEHLEDVFFSIIGDDIEKKNIKLLLAIIWLSLTTYAWEDYDSVCGAFYNGLYYLEEVL